MYTARTLSRQPESDFVYYENMSVCHSSEALSEVDEYNIGDGGMSDLPGNGLVIIGPPTGLEKIYDYEPGGHHPVHLGDILHRRYKVIHKLGSGGYSNVWLCRDTNSSEARYVAIKIITAEGSTSECPELRITKLIDMGIAAEVAAQHFCLPLDQFSIMGPNGEHHALVYPVLGPRISRLFNKVNDDDLDATLRKAARQVTQAMSILHAHGIRHGDFRPANILARISNLDGLSEEETLQLVGKPRQTRVLTASRKKHDIPIAPQYLVYPIVWEDIAQDPSAASFITGEACIIDFGEYFEASNPPSDLGIPQIYCSPEYVLDKTVDASCDLWALACTLFEIRTGRRLFDTFDDDPDEYLRKVALVLGKLPEPRWSTTWEARSFFLVDEVDESGKVIEVSRQTQLPEEDNAGEGGSDNGKKIGALIYQKSEPTSLRELIDEGLFYGFRYKPWGVWKEIPEAEVDCFVDLLGKFLRYQPEERLEAVDALEHPWFKM
ncbi:kinase-like domain-containing protein [Hypoxylon sp. FL1284]|nr:kinase-like domain-containing protein [Hypoxylon sp. FL1284]